MFQVSRSWVLLQPWNLENLEALYYGSPVPRSMLSIALFTSVFLLWGRSGFIFNNCCQAARAPSLSRFAFHLISPRLNREFALPGSRSEERRVGKECRLELRADAFRVKTGGVG